jgi:hypothetical protein
MKWRQVRGGHDNRACTLQIYHMTTDVFPRISSLTADQQARAVVAEHQGSGWPWRVGWPAPAASLPITHAER